VRGRKKEEDREIGGKGVFIFQVSPKQIRTPRSGLMARSMSRPGPHSSLGLCGYNVDPEWCEEGRKKKTEKLGGKEYLYLSSG
jgi:hypothetical protein